MLKGCQFVTFRPGNDRGASMAHFTFHLAENGDSGHRRVLLEEKFGSDNRPWKPKWIKCPVRK